MRICELVFRPSAPRAPLTRVRKLVALGALVARDFGPLLVFYGTYAMFGFVPALLNHPCVDDDGGAGHPPHHGSVLWLVAPRRENLEAAERRAASLGKPLSLWPVVLSYFRGCTLVWTAYFFLKAALYAWINALYAFETALSLRVLIGNATFYALLAGGFFLVKLIIRAMQRRADSSAHAAA